MSSHQRMSLCSLSLKRRWHLSRRNDLNHAMKRLLTAWFTQFYCFEQRLNSYQLCEKVFASDWESQLVYSQFIILRSTINWNESIKMLNANLESTAITCRTTESNEYLWWNSATISISSWSLQWFSFTSIKNFILEWVLIQIWLMMKQLMNNLKLEKQIILSFK